MEIDYRVYILNKGEHRRFVFVLILTALAIGIVFYNSILFAPAAAFLYRPARNIYEKYLIKKRKAALRLQFRDFLYSLSSSFAAGRHMEESVSEAKEEFAGMYRCSDYIMQELDVMIHRMKDAGEPDICTLENFADRAETEDIDIFVQVYKACRETGGDIVGSINKSASVIGEKITIENEIRAMVSQKKFEGKIITAMPILIILFLRIMSPEYLDVMYESLAGRLMMTLALAATAGAYFLIERITNIEV